MLFENPHAIQDGKSTWGFGLGIRPKLLRVCLTFHLRWWLIKQLKMTSELVKLFREESVYVRYE